MRALCDEALPQHPRGHQRGFFNDLVSTQQLVERPISEIRARDANRRRRISKIEASRQNPGAQMSCDELSGGVFYCGECDLGKHTKNLNTIYYSEPTINPHDRCTGTEQRNNQLVLSLVGIEADAGVSVGVGLF